MSILEEMLKMFATTVQADLNATLRVCEIGLQDVLTNRSNFTSNVVFQFLYGAWRLKRKNLCQQATHHAATGKVYILTFVVHIPVSCITVHSDS
jgi:hypothetical protein